MQTSFFGKQSSAADEPEDGAQQKKPGQRIRYVPWVEKYRPSTMDEVVSQEDVVAVLKKALGGADFPNLLFYGPPGTGKTSTILAICKQLFGKSSYRERTMELNASDERGINVVRQKVKSFAQVTVRDKTSDGKPCPPFKIIILDEADSMTQPAQAALRRTMEKWTHSTRFCLICNYVSRIIEPITSRCAKFRFKPLPRDLVQGRLEFIAKAEGVTLDDGAVTSLIDVSEGDMRKAITYMQCAYRLGGSKPVNKMIVDDIAGCVDSAAITLLVKICRTGSFDTIQSNIKGLLMSGYAASQIISQLHDHLMFEDEHFNDMQKSKIFEAMAVADKCLLDGADDYLQLLSLATVVMEAQNAQ